MLHRAFLITVSLVYCVGYSGLCWATQIGTIALEYVAPPSCPTKEELWLRLRSYTPLATEMEAERGSASIVITVETSLEGFSGQLTVVTPEQRMTRRLSDVHCGALLDALALIAAIATDPTHRNVLAPARPKSSVSKPMQIRMQVGRARRWTLGIALGLGSAAAPVVLRTIGAYMSVHRNDFGMASHYFASLGFGQTEWLPYHFGDAKFTWFGARIAACPARSAIRGFSFGACALTEFGWLQGKGVSEAGRTSTGGAWVAPGLGLSMSLLISRLELGFVSGVVRPLVRDRFYFSPDETVFRASRLGLVAEMCLGWVIW